MMFRNRIVYTWPLGCPFITTRMKVEGQVLIGILIISRGITVLAKEKRESSRQRADRPE